MLPEEGSCVKPRHGRKFGSWKRRLVSVSCYWPNFCAPVMTHSHPCRPQLFGKFSDPRDRYSVVWLPGSSPCAPGKGNASKPPNDFTPDVLLGSNSVAHPSVRRVKEFSIQFADWCRQSTRGFLWPGNYSGINSDLSATVARTPAVTFGCYGGVFRLGARFVLSTARRVRMKRL